MHHADGDGACQLDAEITVGHAIQTVGAGGGKAQLFGGEIPVQRVGGCLLYTSEDKEAIFDAVDTLELCLKTITPMLDTMKTLPCLLYTSRCV